MRTSLRLALPLLALAALAAAPAVLAGDDAPAAPAAKDAPVVLHNAVCPVTGEAVTENVTADWNGMRIGFCCAGCVAKFEAEPVKYVPTLLKDLAGQVAALKRAHEEECEPAVPTTPAKPAEPAPAAPAAGGTPPPAPAVVDIGNLNCPVMPHHKAKEAAALEYHGMKVRFCCKGCFGKFNADPEGYLAKVKASDAEAAKKIEQAEAAWKASQAGAR